MNLWENTALSANRNLYQGNKKLKAAKHRKLRRIIKIMSMSGQQLFAQY
jgi:hypothetical protein